MAPARSIPWPAVQPLASSEAAWGGDAQFDAESMLNAATLLGVPPDGDSPWGKLPSSSGFASRTVARDVVE
jgi:hypothetical protein